MHEVMKSMNASIRTASLWGTAVAVLMMMGVSTSAYADRDHRGGPRGYYDHRYNHNHYYPSRGYVVGSIRGPRYVVTDRYRHRYFYSGGVWYAPRGPRFVVVGPPLGVFVPILPSYYSTIWVGGSPYYYANDSYYVWRERERAYEVVGKPDDNGASASTQAPPSDEIFVYPKNGQSSEQTAKDRYECHRWASGETGFDPTVAGGGVPNEQNGSKRDDYNRAMAACLEGRGYSVK
jgi:hypothetical protein